MKKPKLSFWQIWNLSFGFLGVQIGYSLQNSNTSTIFQSLGADVSQLSYFWLAAPLAMGAFILLFMDTSFNVTMLPFRALVSDMLDDSQKTEGYVVQTFLINLGAVVGGILPLVMTWLGVSDTAEPGQVARHIAYSYYAGGIILLLTVLWTSFRVKEYPPEEFAKYNGIEQTKEEEPKQSFFTLLRDTPKVMLQLGVTQFFSWAAIFLMWTYLKPAMTGVVTDPSGAILTEGATQTWVGVLNAIYPIPACIAAIFMARIAERFGNKPVYSVCLLFGALGFFGITMLHNQFAIILPMIGIGIAWAGILAMPYSQGRLMPDVQASIWAFSTLP